MARASRPAHPPRPRAVADLALDALLAEGELQARSWAAALVQGGSRESLGNVPLAEIAGGGQDLCGQLIRAVAADGELSRLESGQGLSEQALAPLLILRREGGAASVVEGVEALREVLAGALSGDAGELRPGLAGMRRSEELADRLAHVCSRLAVLVLRDGRSLPPDAPAPGPVASEPAGERVEPVELGTKLVDERATRADPEPPAPPRRFSPLRPGRGEGLWARTAPRPAEPVGRAEIAIRDERRAEGPAAWIRIIGRQLQRYAGDGRPFAVVLAELEDPVLADEQPTEAWLRRCALVEQALGERALQLGGALTRERPGRWWLMAPAIGAAGASQLVGGLRTELGARVEAEGGTLAIGAAACPEHGQTAAALAAHADTALLAAHARGRGSLGSGRDGGGLRS